MFGYFIIDPFWGNFLIGLSGALLSRAWRIFEKVKPFDPPGIKINRIYLMFVLIFSLAGGFLTAFIFRNVVDILYIESLIVGIMSQDFFAHWIIKLPIPEDKEK